MKSFSFRLQRVLVYRILLNDQAQMRLQQLMSQQEQLKLELLNNQRSQSEAWVIATPGSEISLSELQSASSHRQALKKDCIRLTRQMDEVAQKIQKQQLVVRETRRNQQLLEKLKTRRHEQWMTDQDRELEEIAADAYRSRLHSSRSLIEERKVLI